ncbi:hypothetical protein D9M70_446370 [compost metagenome]
MAEDHQTEGDQGPDDRQPGLHHHRLAQGERLERNPSPVMHCATHRHGRQAEQRSADHCRQQARLHTEQRQPGQRPAMDRRQHDQHAQLQRVEQRQVRQRLGRPVAEQVDQPEPGEQQQRHRQRGDGAVLAGIDRHRPRQLSRQPHENQEQARHQRPAQPAPGVVMLGQ